MRRLELEIGSLVVVTSLDRRRAERIPDRLRAAFDALGERLSRVPGGRESPIAPYAIESIELELRDLERLLAPGGEAWLAEALHRRLLEANAAG